MDIVLNCCFGGFSLSNEACAILRCGLYDFSDTENATRTNPDLIDCVRKLGYRANGPCANLRIVRIPENATDWEINEYDGAESLICVVNGKLIHM